MLRNELHHVHMQGEGPLHFETDGVCVSREKREAGGRCARFAVITF